MSAHWSHRPEGGGRFAIWLIRSIALHAGRPFARLLLYPATLYFYLRRCHERQASRAFLRRVLQRPVHAWHVMHHIHRFAGTILDRVFFLTRGLHGFAVQTQGLDQLDAALAKGRGVLLLGSHHGSFEALRVLADRIEDVPLRIVLDKSQTPILTELLEALSPGLAECIIDAAGDPTSVVLALSEAAASGHMLALLADRGRVDEGVHRVPFLGKMAPFPAGPFALAAALKVPVVLCFGLYQGGNRYTLVFEPFADPVVLPRERRQDALREIVTRYAARLEHYVRLEPYNWFNFYDFWQEDHAADARGDAAPAVQRGRRA